ncbi:phosphinothricin N-acetyltransferase [Bacillus sp. 1NLA3E]|nr:phosphinothricin N-acetyltransferase [Bacillus sp. 1NLA3E]
MDSVCTHSNIIYFHMEWIPNCLSKNEPVIARILFNDRLDWFNEHNPYKRPLWIVEYGGEICGWVSLQSFYGRPAYNATAEISIYLHEDFRGKGLGKKILNKVIEECPRFEIDTSWIHLWTQ